MGVPWRGDRAQRGGRIGSSASPAPAIRDDPGRWPQFLCFILGSSAPVGIADLGSGNRWDPAGDADDRLLIRRSGAGVSSLACRLVSLDEIR